MGREPEELDPELERLRSLMFESAIFSTTIPYSGVDYSAEADAGYLDGGDDPESLVPVRPKSRPPARSGRVALPEPDTL